MIELLRQALNLYSQLRDEVVLTIEASRATDPKYASYTGMVLHYYSDRCQTINLLLQDFKLWDADIIMRPALECATRFLFVSTAKPCERHLLIDECTISLNEIEDIQRSEKARNFAKDTNDDDTRMLVGGAVLDDETLKELRVRWPKTKRSALKQKWSFNEMVRFLTSFCQEGLDLREYRSLLHSYGLSSHFIHADQTAMNLVRDREMRHPTERNLLEKAHFARLATEQVTMLFICWRALAYATGVDSKKKSIFLELAELEKKASVYHEEFARSQDDLYNKTRRPF